MFSSVGVQSDDSTDRQVGDQAEEQACKHSRTPSAAAPKPIKVSCNQNQPDERLKFAPGRVSETGFAEPSRLGLNIAIHVEIPGQSNQTSVFGDGAGDDDRAHEKRWWRAQLWSRRMLRSGTKSEIHRDDESHHQREIPQLAQVSLCQDQDNSNERKYKASFFTECA